MTKPDVSFVIATRNRLDLLIPCLRACLAQTGITSEILVYDDASDEEIRPIIDREFGDRIRVVRLEQNIGQPAVRSKGYREAAGEIIVSIDDDAILLDREILASVDPLFCQDKSVGIVALRYYEPPRAGGTLVFDHSVQELRSFVGCAAVIRREYALECECYPDWICRQGEERFLAIRMLDRGYRIVLFGPPSLIHLASPVRNRKAMQWYGIRNALLFDWICAPHPYLVPYLAKDIIKLFFYKIRLSRIPTKVAAIGWGLGSIVKMRHLRRPVRRSTFKKYLTLPRHGALRVPMDWSPEPLVNMGIFKSIAEIEPYLDSTPFGK